MQANADFIVRGDRALLQKFKGFYSPNSGTL